MIKYWRLSTTAAAISATFICRTATAVTRAPAESISNKFSGRWTMLAMTAMSGYSLTYVLPLERVLMAVVLAFLVSQVACLSPGGAGGAYPHIGRHPV